MKLIFSATCFLCIGLPIRFLGILWGIFLLAWWWILCDLETGRNYLFMKVGRSAVLEPKKKSTTLSIVQSGYKLHGDFLVFQFTDAGSFYDKGIWTDDMDNHMKVGEYIDRVKAERNAATEREAHVRKALRRFLFLHVRQQDGAVIKPEEWDDAICMAQEALSSEAPNE